MSSYKWAIHKLRDLCTKIGSGATPRGGKESYLEEGPYALIRSQNILDFFFSYDGLAFIDEDQANQLNNVELQTRDVLLNITGDSVARVCQVPEELLPARVNQHVSIIRPDNSKLIPEYLKYFLLNPEFKNYMLGLASVGATRNALTKGMIEDFDIEVPLLPTQRRIADILSALDEKIELNRQTNVTLEAMAQSIFREWFVEFNFPGATGKLNESELGEIPEEWKICTLENISKRITDGAHGSPKSVDVGYPMASVKDMRTWGIDLKSCRKISKEDYLQLVRSDCKPLKNDILIAKDGSYLKHIFVTQEEVDLAVLSSIAILRPNEQIVNPYVLSYILKQQSVLERMKNYVSGAVIQRIVIKDFKKFKVALPPLELQQQWASICDVILKKCWENVRENEMLSQVRNTFLPKLMSGEIETRP